MKALLAMLLLVGCVDHDDDQPVELPTCASLSLACGDDRPLLCNAEGVCNCDPDGFDGPEPAQQCTRSTP